MITTLSLLALTIASFGCDDPDEFTCQDAADLGEEDAAALGCAIEVRQMSVQGKSFPDAGLQGSALQYEKLPLRLKTQCNMEKDNYYCPWPGGY
jgi:hypothetical protein